MRRPSCSTAMSIVALIFAMSGSAYAVTGGSFVLGHRNTTSAVSTLRNTHGTALALTAPAGKPALSVSNTTQIGRLNASYLQGKSPSAFLAAGGTAVNATHLGGLPASGFLASDGTAANAKALGGSPAGSFGAVETARITAVPAAGGCAGPGSCSTAYYGSVSGLSSANATETNADTLSPAQPMVLRNLSALALAAPGGSSTLQVGVSVNGGAGTTLRCLITGSLTLSCTDGSDAVSVPAGSRISIVIVGTQPGGSGGFPAETVLVGFTMSPV